MARLLRCPRWIDAQASTPCLRRLAASLVAKDSMTRLFRRRRFLIDALQYRLLAVNLVYSCLIMLLFAGALFGPLTEQLLSGDASTPMWEAAAEQFLALDDRIWLPLLLTLFCFAVHSIFLSHRIAGPLYQLRRVLGEVGDGNLAVRATLRKRDYLLKEATVVNEMIKRVGTRIADIDEKARELHPGLRSLRSAIHSGRKEDILMCLTSLDENSACLSAMLSQFKTRRERKPTGQAQTEDPGLPSAKAS